MALLAPPVLAQAPTIQESALRQIESLLAEKTSRSPAQKKIGSHLLYTLKRQRGDALFQALPDLRTSVELDRDGRVLVDIRADVNEALLAYIEVLGGTVINSVPQYGSIRAHFPLDELETLASNEDIRSIRTAERFMLNKVNTSEGDVAHATDAARALFAGADGQPEGRTACLAPS